MKLIDIHAHLDFKDFDADRTAVIDRLREAECGVINVGVDIPTSRAVVRLAEENKMMWATVGFHPADPEAQTEPTEADWQELEKLASHEKVVAIGECGLEKRGGRWEGGGEQIQKAKFERQVDLAQRVGKPLMIHCREAYDDLLEICKLRPSRSNLRANIHFFAGDLEQAKAFLDLGFTLSFTGVITFPVKSPDGDHGASTHDVIKNLPLNKIMAETDSPFVAPVPYRGKRNEPLYVREVVQKIAEIKNLPLPEVEAALLKNAIAFLGNVC